MYYDSEVFSRLADDESAYEWLSTVAAMCNSDGGALYIGIDKHTGEIGLSLEEAADQIILFIQMVQTYIRPVPVYRFLPHIDKERRLVLIVHIHKGNRPCYALNWPGHSGIYIRKKKDKAVLHRRLAKFKP